MWQDIEGGIYWDELAETCSDISRAEKFQGAVRFRGNTCTYIVHVHVHVRYANIIFVLGIWGPTANYNSCQYFWLYSIYHKVALVATCMHVNILCPTHF